MTLLFGVVLGFLSGAGVLHLVRPLLDAPALARTNFRGRQVPTAAGLAAVVATTAAATAWAFVDPDHAPVFVLFPVLGFGLLGFVDDVLAAGLDRGFAGHMRALAHGRLTTGGLKLLGGAVIGVLVGVLADGNDHWRVVVDALLVALAANAGNLFDRRPGRTIKVGVIVAVVIVLLARRWDADLVGCAIAVGAFLALLRADLAEELMLGDTGANVLGGALGLAVLVTAPIDARVVVVVALGALNVLSERVSFSDVIDRVPPLRWIDRLGRAPR